jgi:predicted RNA-binding Zn-ribbon protein involved in translation (DUF1610 family)
MDWGDVPKDGHTWVDWACPHCERVADLPVAGLVIAQTPSGGLIFDRPSEGRTPRIIRCRKCRYVFGHEGALDERWPSEDCEDVR